MNPTNHTEERLYSRSPARRYGTPPHFPLVKLSGRALFSLLPTQATGGADETRGRGHQRVIRNSGGGVRPPMIGFLAKWKIPSRLRTTGPGMTTRLACRAITVRSQARGGPAAVQKKRALAPATPLGSIRAAPHAREATTAEDPRHVPSGRAAGHAAAANQPARRGAGKRREERPRGARAARRFPSPRPRPRGG